MDTRQKILRRLRRYGFCKVRKDPDALCWGILGLGNMAEVFSSVLDASKKDKIVAVASRNLSKAQAFATKHGCPRAYGSYYEMLSDRELSLDIVYIATPVIYHFEDVKMALLAGRNVLCEKPITSDASQLEELQTLAKEQGCFLMEGMWMKCLPVFRQAKEMIGCGMIGEIELTRVDFYKREVVDSSRSIFNKVEGGGVLMDYGIYAVAFALEFLGGDPESVRYEVRKNTEGLDTDWSIVMNRGGIRAIVNISSDFNSASKATVIGTEGSIEWDTQFNRTNHIKRFNSLNQLQEERTFSYDYDGYEFEITHVRDCLKKGLRESPIVSLDSSLVTMRIVDTLYK